MSEKSLLDQWRGMAYDQTLSKDQLEKFWANYFLIEKGIYENGKRAAAILRQPFLFGFRAFPNTRYSVALLVRGGVLGGLPFDDIAVIGIGKGLVFREGFHLLRQAHKEDVGPQVHRLLHFAAETGAGSL